jgi:hypothetical protein
MNLTRHRLRNRRSPRSRRQRKAAGSAAFGVAVAAALVFVYAAVLGPGFAGTTPLLAGFEARSYAPGQTALLDIGGGAASSVTLQVFQAGGALAPGAAPGGRDRITFGEPMTAPQEIRRPGAGTGACTLASARTGRAATTSHA